MEGHLLGNDLSIAVAENHGTGGGHGTKSIHALLSAVLLPKAYGNIEKDDTSKDASFNVILDTKAESHSKNENLVKWLARLAKYVL